MIFRRTIINNCFLSFPKSLLLLAAILNKNPPLAQRRQNIETSNLSSTWLASHCWANVGKNLMMVRPIDNTGPTLAKSADHATNSQRRSDGGMPSTFDVDHFG